MRSVLHILLLVVYCKYTTAVYFNISNENSTSIDIGEPLYLTEYLEKGLCEEAQEKAKVHHPALEGLQSYAGFITINKTYNSNTFFWFFPSQSNPKEDPIALWFIGGPALSTFTSIFLHNGPLNFTSKKIVESREYGLTNNHSIIYIDNPVGTGFSFTENDLGYARNQSDVARDVIEFLVQFFQIFHQYRQNDFYIGGDSYGGKYVISTSHALSKYNYQGKFFINFRGIFMGNGLSDLKVQGVHSEYLYQIGLVDKKGRDTLKNYEINNGLSLADEKDVLLQNLTGYVFYNNILYNDYDYNSWFAPWIRSRGFRKAVHVGNKEVNITSDLVRSFFEAVNLHPVTEFFEDILRHNYRVLVYNGQLDMQFPYTSSQQLYENLTWSGVQEYRDAERDQWFVDDELAGFVRVARNFYEVLVRDAGHVAFIEQSKWCAELVTRFTRYKPIAQGKPEEKKSYPVQGRSYEIF